MSERNTPASEVARSESHDLDLGPASWTLHIFPGTTTILPIQDLGVQVQISPLLDISTSTQGRNRVPATIKIIAASSSLSGPATLVEKNSEIVAPNAGRGRSRSPSREDAQQPARWRDRSPVSHQHRGTPDSTAKRSAWQSRSRSHLSGVNTAMTNSPTARKQPTRAINPTNNSQDPFNRQGQPSSDPTRRKLDNRPLDVQIASMEKAIQDDMRCLNKLKPKRKEPDGKAKLDECYGRLHTHKKRLEQLQLEASSLALLESAQPASLNRARSHHHTEKNSANSLEPGEATASQEPGKRDQRTPLGPQQGQPSVIASIEHNEHQYRRGRMQSRPQQEESRVEERAKKYEDLVRMGREEARIVRDWDKSDRRRDSHDGVPDVRVFVDLDRETPNGRDEEELFGNLPY